MTVLNVANQYLAGPTTTEIVGRITRIQQGSGNYGPTILVTIERPDGDSFTMSFGASTSPSSKWGLFLNALCGTLQVGVHDLSSVLPATWIEFKLTTFSFGRGEDVREVQVWMPRKVVDPSELVLELNQSDIAILGMWPQEGVESQDDLAAYIASVAAQHPDAMALLDYLNEKPDYIRYLTERQVIAQESGRWKFVGLPD